MVISGLYSVSGATTSKVRELNRRKMEIQWIDGKKTIKSEFSLVAVCQRERIRREPDNF